MRSSTVAKGLFWGTLGGLAAYLCGSALALMAILTAAQAAAMASAVFALGFLWAIMEDQEEEGAIEV